MNENEIAAKFGLISSEFLLEKDFNEGQICPVKFVRMNSPFYDGVKWSVRWLQNCMGHDGNFSYEPSPSNRDQGFYSEFRFDSLEEAVSVYLKFQGGKNGN